MNCSKTDKLFERAEELRQKSHYRKSLALLRNALKSYVSSKSLEGVTNCQLSIGDVHRMIGDFDSAEQSYFAALTTGRKSDDKVTIADAQLNIGLSLRGKGDWRNALQMSKDALTFYRKIKDFKRWPSLSGRLPER